MRFRPGFYNTLYRLKVAPWDTGCRPVLTELVDAGRLTPADYPAVADLGCGTGAESVYLASKGFDPVVGVDFSPVAIRRATARAEAAGVAHRCHFYQADLTAPEVPGMTRTFDLICDFGVVDDTEQEDREAAVRLIHRISRPGSVVLIWAFQGDKSKKRWPATIAPMLAPGEEKALFGECFDIEYLPTRPNTLMLWMTRRTQ
ncbi:methyltransferase domain-containing protein [Natronosporangium hydrolyticum]|uniref:Methyltransferase domain-containing protein n=1 Tax=Natronosporangium hydrolyticum TaxID=2811111 RepID=A0A895YEZ3_9ACTN|nr:class I SAM-dependent methyltransferase [Natronosporangium hydrolyticum]QSB13989.1 methyltransferase domain-containing protein [Natronosporangium hydrolyticum]